MSVITPSLNDLSAPFDPTAYKSISGAQLLQLIAGATPTEGKGLVFSTIDNGDGSPNKPNTTTVPRWKEYIWRRISATGVAAYIWSDYANDWVTVTLAGIGQNTITGGPVGKIALNTITDANIANGALQWSKVVNAPDFVSVNDIINIGDLAGSAYGSAVIKAQSVTTNKIFDGAVTAIKIPTLAVDNTKIIPNPNAYWMMRVKVDSTAVEWFQPPVIFQGTMGLGLAGGNAAGLVGKHGQFIRVNTAETDFEFGIPNAGAIVGATKNLLMAAGAQAITIVATPCSSTVMRVAADSIVMKDIDGNFITKAFTAGYSVNFSQSSSALLGPDAGVLYTGTKPQTGWYYIWAVSDGTLLSFFFSASATSLTLGGFTSYIYSALVGAVYLTNNSSGGGSPTYTIVATNMFQQERTVWLLPIDNNNNITSNATPGTPNAFALSGVLPPITKSVKMTTQNTSGTGFATAGVSVYDTAIGKFGLTVGTAGTTQVQLGFAIHEVPVISVATIKVISSVASTTMDYTVGKYTI